MDEPMSDDVICAKLRGGGAQWPIPQLAATRIATLTAQRDELARQLEAAREGLAAAHGAIAEYYRYWTGGETRGSYDGKPERANLWKAKEIARATLARITPKEPV